MFVCMSLFVFFMFLSKYGFYTKDSVKSCLEMKYHLLEVKEMVAKRSYLINLYKKKKDIKMQFPQDCSVYIASKYFPQKSFT